MTTSCQGVFSAGLSREESCFFRVDVRLKNYYLAIFLVWHVWR
jgi:hypothetical protein